MMNLSGDEESIVNGPGTTRKALRRPKTRLFVVLAVWVTALVTATFTSVPYAAADGPYYVVNSATKMMAEVFARRTDNGAPVILWPNYGSPSQQFFPLVVAHTDVFRLQAVHSGKCLQAAGDQSGTAVVQAECIGDKSQIWRVREVRITPAECPTGMCFAVFRRVLENFRAHRCLDAANARFPAPPAQGAGLQVWDCIPRYTAPNAVNQDWELVNINNWGAPGPFIH
jgi:Ricin-type beta-trefoil lectin domain